MLTTPTFVKNPLASFQTNNYVKRMLATAPRKSNHARFELRYLLVLTTTAPKALPLALQTELRAIATELLEAGRCTLEQCWCGESYIALQFTGHPAVELSRLINTLKSASSRRLHNRHRRHFRDALAERGLWRQSYYITSLGPQGAPETMVRRLARNLAKGEE